MWVWVDVGLGDCTRLEVALDLNKNVLVPCCCNQVCWEKFCRYFDVEEKVRGRGEGMRPRGAGVGGVCGTCMIYHSCPIDL